MQQQLKKGGFIKALKLVEKKKKSDYSNMRPQFDSGSEGSRRGYSPVDEEQQYGRQQSESDLMDFEQNETFKPIIMNDSKETNESQYSQQIIGSKKSKFGSAIKQTEGFQVNTANLLGHDDIEALDGSAIRSLESHKDETLENYSNLAISSKAHSIIVPKKKMVELTVPPSI